MADDLFGDGVNVASRIEGLAPPGGICITESIHSAISSHPQFETIPLGRKKLKNIRYGYKIYRIKTDYDHKKQTVVSSGKSQISNIFKAGTLSLFRSKRILVYLVGIIVIGSVIWIYSSLFLPGKTTSNETVVPEKKISEVDVPPQQQNQLINKYGIDFINEMRTIQNYPQLEKYLQSNRQAGKIKFGSMRDFINLEGKYVVIFDMDKIYTVLIYTNDKYIDLYNNREYVELSQYFRGKRQCWVELIEK
jgi:hypothetical protein